MLPFFINGGVYVYPNLVFSQQLDCNAEIPNHYQHHQVQQLVEAVEHPVGLLLHVGQSGETGREPAFCRVDEEVRDEFQKHKQQQRFPRRLPAQQADAH